VRLPIVTLDSDDSVGSWELELVVDIAPQSHVLGESRTPENCVVGALKWNNLEEELFYSEIFGVPKVMSSFMPPSDLAFLLGTTPWKLTLL
jgi:hypothetical protein